uniref:Uncharacterized protein n=1 Tax=Pristionchus pacificus TaxID=54126 RepID=A0A2A6B5C2_PRIPA|eukprot:PDM61074.1 hypothetical protein PRIPAC_54880 [Pristionchus pacificus]
MKRKGAREETSRGERVTQYETRRGTMKGIEEGGNVNSEPKLFLSEDTQGKQGGPQNGMRDE